MKPKDPSKLIFINRYFYPDLSATSQMLSDLTFELAKENDNYAVHVVTSRQLYDNASAQLVPEEVIKNVHIHRVLTTRFGRQNLLGRAIDYLSFYFSSFVYLLTLTNSQDTLIAKTDPPLISLISALVCKLKGAQLVNWLQDLFPEVAAELGIKLASGTLYKALKTLRNLSLKQAKMNVVIGELMGQRLRQEGIPNSQITIIHNWADEEQLHPISNKQNPLRETWELQDKFVVGYSGNLGRGHDFSTILGAAEVLSANPNIAFLLIGSGAQLPQLQQECKNRGLNNVTFKPYQPREKLSESLSVADIHLISLKPELESLIVPSKFYGILAVDRPVIFIGAEEGELAKIIHKYNCGNVVTQYDFNRLAETINDMASKIKSTNQNNSLRNLFLTHFSKKKATQHFVRILT